MACRAQRAQGHCRDVAGRRGRSGEADGVGPGIVDGAREAGTGDDDPVSGRWCGAAEDVHFGKIR